MDAQKEWGDGGLLTITYDGYRDGSATFSSERNESIDRSMTVLFVESTRSVIVERSVRQEGLREVLNASDGVLITADGKTLNVLK